MALATLAPTCVAHLSSSLWPAIESGAMPAGRRYDYPPFPDGSGKAETERGKKCAVRITQPVRYRDEGYWEEK